MKYEIVELEEFSGSNASVYSIIVGGRSQTLFDDFVDEYDKDYETEVTKLSIRLQEIGRKGVREHYVKLNEGIPGDGVCALYDEPDHQLRLYAIRYGASAIVIGGGGYKSADTRAWQDNLKLKKHAELMIAISKELTKKITAKEIQFSGNGKILEGELYFEIE